MNPRTAGLVIAVAALVVVGALVLAPWRAERPAAAPVAEPETPVEAPVAEVPAPALERRAVTLYLPAEGGVIAPLATEIESASEPKARVEALVRALIAARPKPPLAPLFAGVEVQLAGTMRGAGATLYLDLVGEDAALPPPASGSQLELQRVYALVQTVVENEPAYERVALLWAGVQRPTFAGHVDTGHALVPWPAIVAPAAGGGEGADSAPGATAAGGREPEPPGAR